jgi:DNA adenine methylase
MKTPPSIHNSNSLGVAPILKWVGGKRVILDALRANVKSGDASLVEPFIGGGALSFSVPTNGQIFIGDLNWELVNLYRVVAKKSDAEQLIAQLQTKEFRVSEDNFYKIRSWDVVNELKTLDPIKVAARTYFLNRIGFNGLFRVNSNGKFNVPFGKKSSDFVWDLESIRALQRLLASKLEGSSKKRFIIQDPGSYQEQLAQVFRDTKANLTIYLDPPYASAPSTTSKTGKPQSFKAYQKGGFSNLDHEILAKFVKNIPNKHQVLVSNVSTAEVQKWYSGMYYLTLPSVRRRVSGKTSGRTGVDEILISNRPLSFELDGVHLENGRLN